MHSTYITKQLAQPFINILEVGPRDGLQNIPKCLPISKKVDLIHRLSDCGIRQIEAGSLVNYKRVPQMQHTPQVLEQCYGVDSYLSVLVPSSKQMDSLPKQVDEIVLFVSVSETFNSKNIQTTIDGAFQRFQEIMHKVNDMPQKHLKVRGSISCCFGCPYEGKLDFVQISNVIDRYQKLGVHSIDICDTIGIATPTAVEAVLEQIMPRSIVPLNLHLHDTNGQAVQSALTGVEMGIRCLHASIAGLGGCPFSPKRAGNVSTEELVAALHAEGYETGINEWKLGMVSNWIQKQVLL